jgi:hypothetical protein
MDYIDEERLRETLAGAPAAYQAASPFPHIVIDGFLKAEVAAALEAQFPKVDHTLWKHHLHLNSHKFACNTLGALPELFQAVIRELNSPPLLEYLEALTGIAGLSADGELEGGGLHQIVPGGYLRVHADFNYHPATGYHRRLNLLLYLNREWRGEWDGNLELWRPDMSGCGKSVVPALNRCVIFSTTDVAFHGHPRPLKCPPTMSRKSVALYYYTAERPLEEVSRPHSTLYRRATSDARLAERAKVLGALLFSGALYKTVKWHLMEYLSDLFEKF